MSLQPTRVAATKHETYTNKLQ